MKLDSLINAEFDFKAIFDWIKSAYENVISTPAVSDIWEAALDLLGSVPAVLISSVLLALALVEVFFGKRLLGVQKFIGFFLLGFAGGAVYLAPLIPDVLPISPLVVGIVVGAVAALLCKIIYLVAYIGIAGCSVYIIFMGGYYIPKVISDLTKGNMIVSLVIAAVAVVIAILLKKLVEMVGTATLGSLGAWIAFLKLLGDLKITFPESEIIKFTVITVLAVLGTLVQIKTRKRKW